MKKSALIFMLLLLAGVSFGVCPRADLTGDCKVNLEDLAIMAFEWLTEGVPEDPANMVFVNINDPGVAGHEPFTGEMSKYETTNAQYCQFLNAALASDDIRVENNRVYGNSGPYINQLYVETSDYTSSSQITYSDGSFSVRSRDGYSMANFPVLEVSWYGAMAFCDYYDYRLPTEWEWQAVADYDGSYTYGCGASIDFNKANYYDEVFANPLNISYPHTSPVDHFPSYGYGINDMAGNVWEWTSTVNDNNSVLCGGSWGVADYKCAVSFRDGISLDFTGTSIGFRVCR